MQKTLCRRYAVRTLQLCASIHTAQSMQRPNTDSCESTSLKSRNAVGCADVFPWLLWSRTLYRAPRDSSCKTLVMHGRTACLQRTAVVRAPSCWPDSMSALPLICSRLCQQQQFHSKALAKQHQSCYLSACSHTLHSHSTVRAELLHRVVYKL